MIKHITSFENALLLFFFLIVGGLGTLWNISLQNKKMYQISSFGIRHTQSVLEQALQVATLSKDLQLAIGSYIIIDDTSSLYAYQSAKKSLQGSVLSLKALTEDNQDQQQHIYRLNVMLHRLIHFCDSMVQLKKVGRFAGNAIKGFVFERKVLGSIVNMKIDSIQHEEMNLYSKRQEAHTGNLDHAYRFFVLSLLLTFVLIGGAFLFTFYHFGKRKRAEKLMQASEARFQLLVNNIRDVAIYLVDAHGKILNWYQGAADLKGYSKDEVIGQSIAIFYAPEDIEKDEAAHNLEIAEKMGSFEVEGWRVRKDGSRFWADVLITAVYNGSKEVQGFTVVTRDYTQHRIVEEERQLALQKERELSEMKSNFITNASHQFRTPLSTILSSVALLEQYRSADNVQEKRDRHLAQIRSSVQEMNFILKGFLSYGHPAIEKS